MGTETKMDLVARKKQLHSLVKNMAIGPEVVEL